VIFSLTHGIATASTPTITSRRPVRLPYEEKTQEELDALLGLQGTKIEGHQENQRLKNEQRVAKRDAKRNSLSNINLNVFSVPQQRALEKIIDFITKN